MPKLGVKTKESELYRKTQKLRTEYAVYIKNIKEVKKYPIFFNRVNNQINNRFVDILILNELMHEKEKIKKLGV